MTTSKAWPSRAHEQSASCIIDPVYAVGAVSPAAGGRVTGVKWLYGPAELECWRLDQLRQRMQATELKVGYPGKFHTPSSRAWFRQTICESKILRFKANGRVSVHVDAVQVYATSVCDQIHDVCIESLKAGSQCVIAIEALSSELPTIRVSEHDTQWEFSGDEQSWLSCHEYPETTLADMPHHEELVPHTVEAQCIQGVYDLGRELYGHVTIWANKEPIMFVGESQAEANNTDNTHFEQCPELVRVDAGVWRSRDPLALRYIQCAQVVPERVTCDALFRPVQYRGAFACSDERLTKIWMYSAYTLRLCMIDFLLDGVKRDRLPWTGDMAISLMANAFSFGDAEITRRSLVALGRAGVREMDINGIVDYNLWWVISHDLYMLHFDDGEHLDREWVRIVDCLEVMLDCCSDDGVLHPREDAWLFIDWVEEEKHVALQQIWWWSLQSGINLARRKEAVEFAQRLEALAMTLGEHLKRHAWHDQTGFWRGSFFEQSEPTRHGNFLAVLAGLSRGDEATRISEHLIKGQWSEVGTPYMKGLECMALAKAGHVESGLNIIKDYWGGMLDRGATSFWEAYDEQEVGDAAYRFYDRPFGKSLCHAWSSGPAAFLPHMILGLEICADGAAHLRIAPDLGQLTWVSCCIPSVHGEYHINVNEEGTELVVPAGCLVEMGGQTYAGPWQGKLDH